jgi:hypothetical protein
MAYTNPATIQFLVSNSPIDIILPPFGGGIAVQAAKQTLTIPIPTNWCYLFWSFLFQGVGGNFVNSMIQEIRVKINGILLMQVSGPQLDFINQYYKYPASNAPAAVATDCLLVVPFIRQSMKGANQWINFQGQAFGQATIPDVEWETALNCGSADPVSGIAITQCILEMDLVNTNGAGITSISSQNKAKVLPASSGGPGAMMFWNKTTFNSSNSTANQLIGGNGLLYGDINHYHMDSLFFFPPTGTLSNFQVWLNSQEIFQRTAEENYFWQTLNTQRVPTLASPVIDFCETGFADGVKYIAPQATSMRVQFSDTAAEGTPLIQRTIGYLG